MKFYLAICLILIIKFSLAKKNFDLAESGFV